MQLAVTRQVSTSIVDCELTFLDREPIDVARARKQHSLYEAALRDLGVAVLSLPEEPDLPDSVFVEDTALVLDECAIILRPGAASRRAETESIARILAPFRRLLHIQDPARVDGGDILRVGKRIYVGLTRRSDTNAIEQMQEMLTPLGYDVHPVPVTGCLHLKSAVTEAAQDVLLLNPNWVDRGTFHGVKILEIDPSEPHAANALRIDETAIYCAAFPRTRARLDLAGIRIVVVEADELAKAEGALTCCSLILSV
ncbi:MAG: arginine deiminase-related protein [Chloroflexota bacterium]